MASRDRSRLIRRHPLLLASAAALLVAAAVLELTYFQVHKHFIDKKVSEAAPTFVATEHVEASVLSLIVVMLFVRETI